MCPTVTFHKHFKFGRAAATTSPAPAVEEGQLIFHNYHTYTHMKKVTSQPRQINVHAAPWHLEPLRVNNIRMRDVILVKVLYMCVCVCAGLLVRIYEDGNRRQTYKNTVRSMCDWCQLVKTACTRSLCRHVIGVVCSSACCLCDRTYTSVCCTPREHT